jgi:enamine deaminase RidA (YjgF/YER057c/UK114 family)
MEIRRMENTATMRLRELGLTLPPSPPDAGTYVNAVRTGNLLFLAGHVPFRADGSLVMGKLGRDLDAAAGYEAARLAGLGVLVTITREVGSLDRVKRLVRVLGVVNATADFVEHTQVVNGASDLFVAIWGDAGRHARLAVGVASLPFDLALEIEVIAELEG